MRGSWFDPICTKYKVWGHQLNSRQSDLGMGAHAITCKENTRYQGCSPIPLFDRDFPSVTLASIDNPHQFLFPPSWLCLKAWLWDMEVTEGPSWDLINRQCSIHEMIAYHIWAFWSITVRETNTIIEKTQNGPRRGNWRPNYLGISF